MAASASVEAAPRGAMTPVPHRVVSRLQETADTWTLELEPLGESIRPRAGQFDMLYAFGVGEVPISTSGDHDGDGPLTHTIRAVGAVTRALCALEPGAVVGVRGPFGTEWPLAETAGGDVVIVAGGIGLAPLRPAVRHALARRDDYGAVSVLVGARTPQDLLFVSELERWRGRLDAEVDVTVDASAPWDDGVVAVLSSMQRTFAEYPGVGTRVLTTRRPSPVADRIASVVRERLLVGGLDDAAADRLLTALRVYFAGWLLGPPRAEPRALDPELLEQSVRWLMHGCVEFERGPADMGTGAR